MALPVHSPARRRGRREERGVALLIAVISIAILTALAVDFAYTTRVDLQLAANQRDEVRAYYLARSAIGLSRLLMRFQKQLDQAPLGGLNLGSLASNPAVAPLLQQAGVSQADLAQLAGGGGMPGMGGGGLALQLWKMARVDCQMLQGLVASDDGTESKPKSGSSTKFAFDDEFPELAGEMKTRSFGGFNGCFLAQIQDEEEKLNLNKLDSGALSGMAVVPRFLDLFGDKRFEFLYEKEDANGTKLTAPDTLIALHDWMDADNVAAALNITGQAGQDPFVPGFSDENSVYDRYTPRYKAKNAPFDTLDEAYLVGGVNDRFMAAFRDRLTVYPDINSRLNVNTDDPLMLYVAILSVADPIRMDPRLRDPLFIDQVIQKIRLARMYALFPGIGMSVQDFVSVVQAAGVPVNAAIGNNVAGNRFVGDKTNTWSIKAVGEAGEVQKTIHAVVRADGALGKLVYWREE